MHIAESLIDLIGSTPILKLTKFCNENNIEGNIFAKLECFNPLGSSKDRAALYMIEGAEKKGYIKPGGVIIEPTSGNTGIGLAYICANKGYRLILTMPETMSVERRKMLKFLGAEIILTEGSKGMNGAIEKAKELLNSIEGAFMPDQFNNPDNAYSHKATTGPEIILDMNGKIDCFVASVGTGGTLTGVAETLKGFNSDIKIVAVEPDSSAILSGDKPGSHGIQGIGAGFIPSILNVSLIDEVIRVKDIEAVSASKKIAASMGIVAGISSGAALAAAVKIAGYPEYKNKNIVVLFPDTGERYISTELFE